MKATVISFLLLAALLCASPRPSEPHATDTDASLGPADVAVTSFASESVYGISFSESQILSTEEERLYNLIMEYRRQNGLAIIPLSK